MDAKLGKQAELHAGSSQAQHVGPPDNRIAGDEVAIPSPSTRVEKCGLGEGELVIGACMHGACDHLAECG